MPIFLFKYIDNLGITLFEALYWITAVCSLIIIRYRRVIMQIWVDADACPNVIKNILFRAAERVQIQCILVANQMIAIPPSKWIERRQVAQGFDEADNYIVKSLDAGDIVITADIPLAAEAIEKGAIAINPRGELYTTENIKQRLAMRNFMEEMRSTGVQMGGPATFTQQDKSAFANALDRLLVKHSRQTV